MRPCGVVVLDPRGDHLAGLIEREEQCLIQQLVPHLAIEALDVAVLHGLARHDVMPVDPVFLRPGEDGMRGELRAIVADNHAGPSSLLDESCQLPCHPAARDRGVRDGGEALMGDVVRDVQDPEPPAMGHLVVHEVE